MRTSFTPAVTPLPLKILLLSLIVSSVLSPFTAPYLALSLSGIDRLYLWQFITYPLVHPFPSGIVHLAFNLFLIWTFGASLMERLHPKAFFSLLFGSSLFSGLTAYLAMLLFHSTAPFFGTSSLLYALLVAWVILNAEAELLLFFTVPVKARHLLLGLIGLNLMIDLSRSDWIPLFAFIGAALFAYFFTILSCGIRSPFRILEGFENGMLRTVERLRHLGAKPAPPNKIYDIKSGQPLMSDEQFMDAMLARISLYGEETLTPEERKRMQQISEKKVSGRKE
jgi:membrane associated rhomboid family serine protease